MPPEPLELAARSAEQRSHMAYIALPAAQSPSAPPPAQLVHAPTVYIPDTFRIPPAPAAPEPRTLGRVRMPLRALLLCVLLLASMVGWIVLLFVTHTFHVLGDDWFFVVGISGSHVIGLIFMVVIPRWSLRRHRALELVAWRRPTRQDAAWTAAGLALMVGFWFAYWAVIPWTGWDWALPVPLPDGVEVVGFFSWWHAALLGFSAVIVAPFVEETFFRGFMLGGLRRVWWVLPSVLFSAALFSAVHLNLLVILPFTIFGIILALLYLRTRHLTAPALAHAGWNLGVTVIVLLEYGVG